MNSLVGYKFSDQNFNTLQKLSAHHRTSLVWSMKVLCTLIDLLLWFGNQHRRVYFWRDDDSDSVIKQGPRASVSELMKGFSEIMLLSVNW